MKTGVQYIFETCILQIKQLVLRHICEEVLDFKTSKLHIANYEIQQEISQCPIRLGYPKYCTRTNLYHSLLRIISNIELKKSKSIPNYSRSDH